MFTFAGSAEKFDRKSSFRLVFSGFCHEGQPWADRRRWYLRYLRQLYGPFDSFLESMLYKGLAMLPDVFDVLYCID
jgi:hypothetical protein